MGTKRLPKHFVLNEKGSDTTVGDIYIYINHEQGHFNSKIRLLAVPFWIVERAREIAEK